MLRHEQTVSCFCTDALFATTKGKSMRGNACAQAFVSDKGHVAVCPMHEQKDHLSALKLFAEDVGAPEVLVCNPHPTQKKREVQAFCQKTGAKLRILESMTQFADRAELHTGFLKEGARKDMREAHSPLAL